ncbi:MAG: TetR/AcrR family transcriptional regulator [Pseudomonadota bacterium]
MTVAPPDLVDKAPHGNSKVTRQDWLQAARDTLVSKGAADVKILTLSRDLDVSRSSFYWYFRDRTDLLNALLAEWETRNTRCIVDHCARPADSVTAAVCNFFECFIDVRLFDPGLDFAVREWSRRDPEIRAKIDAADAQRLHAIEALFLRFGFNAGEADARARILYFMQLGYHALEVTEPLDMRLGRLEGYLIGFTGTPATPELIDRFRARAAALGGAT